MFSRFSYCINKKVLFCIINKLPDHMFDFKLCYMSFRERTPNISNNNYLFDSIEFPKAILQTKVIKK